MDSLLFLISSSCPQDWCKEFCVHRAQFYVSQLTNAGACHACTDGHPSKKGACRHVPTGPNGKYGPGCGSEDRVVSRKINVKSSFTSPCSLFPDNFCQEHWTLINYWLCCQLSWFQSFNDNRGVCRESHAKKKSMSPMICNYVPAKSHLITSQKRVHHK